MFVKLGVRKTALGCFSTARTLSPLPSVSISCLPLPLSLSPFFDIPPTYLFSSRASIAATRHLPTHLHRCQRNPTTKRRSRPRPQARRQRRPSSKKTLVNPRRQRKQNSKYVVEMHLPPPIISCHFSPLPFQCSNENTRVYIDRSLGITTVLVIPPLQWQSAI